MNLQAPSAYVDNMEHNLILFLKKTQKTTQKKNQPKFPEK